MATYREPKPPKPWRASICMYGRNVHLGQYATKEEAEAVERKERARYLKEKGKI